MRTSWTWTERGRARFVPTLDALVSALGRPADVIDWVAGLPPHRPQPVARESVPERVRRTPSGAMDPWPGADPRTAVNRLLGLLLLGAGEPVITELRDDQGTWTLAVDPVGVGTRSKINTGRSVSGSASVRGRTP